MISLDILQKMNMLDRIAVSKHAKQRIILIRINGIVIFKKERRKNNALYRMWCFGIKRLYN